MSALPEPAGQRLFTILSTELAPREGRWGASMRIAVACMLCVAISMVFKIPAPEYMAYMIFLVSRDDRTATMTSAVGGLVAVTLAIALTLFLSLFDIDEPALRIPAMAAVTFAAMYTTRVFALGQLTFLAGFVAVLLHSLIDDVPSAELFTRAALWGWVIAAVPVTITVVMHQVFGHDAHVTRQRTVCLVLEQLKSALSAREFHAHLPTLRGLVASVSKGPPGKIGNGALASLAEALTILEVVPEDVPERVRATWIAQVDASLRLLKGTSPDSLQFASTPNDDATLPAAVAALTAAFASLRNALSREGAPGAPHEKAKRQLFVPDAFTNPSHWQFALKTTLAVMVSYAIYTLLDWPGARTAMVTCFFVALASLGETMHKLILRISGALIGGLLAGLSLVFVLPHFTDIGQLLLLIGIVSLGAAWIANSSELLSYAGLQIAFAFFLGVLQGYGPATDLTVLRDRVAGILMGNIVVAIVFSSLWPESARTRMRNAISEVLRGSAAVLKGSAAQARLQVAEALFRARQFQLLSAFELSMLDSWAAASRAAAAPAAPNAAPSLESVERLAGASFVAASEHFHGDVPPDALAPFSDWMERSADHLTTGEPLPEAPVVGAVRAESLEGELAARRVIEPLQTEIAHLAGAAARAPLPAHSVTP